MPKKLGIQQLRKIKENIELKSQSSDMVAQVVTNVGSKIIVRHGNNNEYIPALFHSNLGTIVAGDIVKIKHSGNKEATIISVLPRKNLVERINNFNKVKSVAANISQIIITISPIPECDFELLSNYLIMAHKLKVKIVIVINKIDLEKYSENINKIEEFISYISHQQTTILKTSVATKYNLNILKNILHNEASLLIGASGVGKSSITKYLVEDEQIVIGKLKQSKFGSHTTSKSTCYYLGEKSILIDSPGMRSFTNHKTTKEDIYSLFPQIAKLAKLCKFTNCNHISNLGCAIQDSNIQKWILKIFISLGTGAL